MLEVCEEIVECIRDCHSCDATGIHTGTKADACYDCGGVGQVLGGDDIFAAFKAREILGRLK
jgi:DnaJ-class molecular chaperone